MGPVTRASTLRGQRKIFDSLGAPSFAYRYQLYDRDTVGTLEQKLAERIAAAKYDWFFQNHSSMLLFEWPSDRTVDRDYYWREFANCVNRTFDGDSATTFLSDKLSNEALDSCLGTPIASGRAEHRCMFQKGLEARSLAKLVDSVAQNASGLRLKALAFRLESEGEKHSNNFVASLQPVLEESMNMYRDIHYEKLLKIARQAKSDNSAKDVLAKLAENDLTSPRLVRDGSWLMFASLK
ncbi:hypothetical protein HG536_0G04690 [Torulaspora globosa]|uniref:Uncharacterized protein n=1 Tax=Torulaspora globosa TaxID=48254 RepID=A0A7G3ZM71_9SACH|nr:uncharacterized protein HG536_0G04690 [Torulaspora globosa]QLL34607.1 hypothetical protein HG536_0G04690 [Torulaspora globosa]